MTRHLVRATVLATVLATAACTHHAAPTPASPAGAHPSASAPVAGPRPVDVDALLTAPPVFGVATVDRTRAGIDVVAAAAACRPRWSMLFASVAHGVAVDALTQTDGLPVLAVEPWEPGNGPDQPAWSLAETIAGHHDAQYTAVARTVVAYGRPVVVRLAHEMNGRWYPWGRANGNTPAQYVEAWRHVVGLFRAAGAVNAVWLWSPNIASGAAPFAGYYPGDAWTDLVGLVGYGVEASPAQTYDASVRALTALTGKRIVLTETGAGGPTKTAWIRAFGPWLAAHPAVVAFIWTQKPKGQLATGDWRFDDTTTNRDTFRQTLHAAHVACTSTEGTTAP